MKQILMMLFVAVVVSFIAMGDTWTDPKTRIVWRYDVSSGEASVGIEGYGGKRAVDPSTTGAIAIPSVLGGFPVTGIYDSAFKGCSGLTSVTIPEGVTIIGGLAFSGCTGLTSVTIPSSVKRIGGGAFEDCRGLTSVTIPSSVEYIYDYAFDGCSGLMSFVVDEENPEYKSVNGLVLLKDGKTLKQGVNGNVTIPSGVTKIGGSAFCGCSGLKSVTIPSSVTSVESGAFRGCSGLMSFVVDEKNPKYKSVNGLVLSKHGKTLIQGVNGNVTIPSGVTKIGDSAFCGCSGLTSVTIPEGVASIGDCAFRGCSGLKSVTIPEGVMSIKQFAFNGCTGLTSVTIPSSVSIIEKGAFTDCGIIKGVTVSSDTYVATGAFDVPISVGRTAGQGMGFWFGVIGICVVVGLACMLYKNNHRKYEGRRGKGGAERQAKEFVRRRIEDQQHEAEVKGKEILCPNCRKKVLFQDGEDKIECPFCHAMVNFSGAELQGKALKTCLDGRARRSEYWKKVLLLYLVVIIVALPMVMIPVVSSFDGSELSKGGWLSALIGGLLILICGIAMIPITVRRLHDRNMSGWWILWFALLSCIPYLGWIVGIVQFVIVGCLEGKPGPNKYGPDPKGRGVAGGGAAVSESVEERLRKLDDLKAKGVLSEAEYEEQRKKIIGEI